MTDEQPIEASHDDARPDAEPAPVVEETPAAPVSGPAPAAVEPPAPAPQPEVVQTPVTKPVERFAAPEHVTNVTLSTGRILSVDDGVLAAPDDLTPSERASLVANGFTFA